MPSEQQIQSIVADLPSGFSTQVLERFMTDRELRTFYKTYRENLNFQRTNRFVSLKRAVTEGEKELVKAFFSEENKHVSDMAERMGISEATLIYRVNRIVIRLAFQNQDKLGL